MESKPLRLTLVITFAVSAALLLGPYLIASTIVGYFWLFFPDNRTNIAALPISVNLSDRTANGNSTELISGVQFTPPDFMSLLSFPNGIDIQRYAGTSTKLAIVPSMPTSDSSESYSAYEAIVSATPISTLIDYPIHVVPNLMRLAKKVVLLKPMGHPEVKIFNSSFGKAIQLWDSESGNATIIVFDTTGMPVAEMTSEGLDETELKRLIASFRTGGPERPNGIQDAAARISQ